MKRGREEEEHEDHVDSERQVKKAPEPPVQTEGQVDRGSEAEVIEVSQASKTLVDAVELQRGISFNSEEESITVNTELTSESFSQLAKLLVARKAKHLNLVDVTVPDGYYMAPATQETFSAVVASVDSLYVCQSEMEGVLFRILKKALEINKSIRKINLEGLELTTGEVASFAEGVKVNESLERLSLTDVRMKGGAESGAPIELVRALGASSSLTSFVFDDQCMNVRKQFASALANLLTTSKSLRNFTWLCQGMEEDAVKILADALKGNNVLRTLKFTCYEIPQTTVEVLDEVLRGSKSIYELECHYGEMTDQRALTWANWLKHNNSIRSLCLRGEDISGTAVGYIAQALKVNKFVNECVLDYNGLKDVSFDQFIQDLEANRSLVEVSLPYSRYHINYQNYESRINKIVERNEDLVRKLSTYIRKNFGTQGFKGSTLTLKDKEALKFFIQADKKLLVEFMQSQRFLPTDHEKPFKVVNDYIKMHFCELWGMAFRRSIKDVSKTTLAPERAVEASGASKIILQYLPSDAQAVIADFLGTTSDILLVLDDVCAIKVSGEGSGHSVEIL